MYPAWLVQSMCYLSRQTAAAMLRGSPVGSFCFIKAFKAATDERGQPLTMEWAMSQTGGNDYLAEAMLRTVDLATVNIFVRAPAGVQTTSVPTSRLRGMANMQAFCEDFSGATGIPISIDKFTHPAAAYMAS